MLIIYLKSTGKPVQQEFISSFFEKAYYNVEPHYKHIIQNLGGTRTDYAELWLTDEATTAKTLTHEFTVKNGAIVFGNKREVKPQPTTPSETELLRAEITELWYALLMQGGGN